MLALDKTRAETEADRLDARKAFIRARNVEHSYARRLRKIARHVGDLIGTLWHTDDPTGGAARVDEAMGRYARLLEPWARTVGERMLHEIAARDKRAWRYMSAEISRGLSEEIATAPTGRVFQQRLAAQVDLITSLPREAAERVHRLTMQAMTQGKRIDWVASEIMRSGHVTRSRADLIARTEVGRTHTEFQRARAESVGVTHYKWVARHDAQTRHDHRILDGKIFAYAEPPIADQRTGERYHPGCGPNCRCISIPVVD